MIKIQSKMPFKFGLLAFLGLLILLGTISFYNYVNESKEQLVERNKQQAIVMIKKELKDEEIRVSEIANSIMAFYKGSHLVEPEEFAIFNKIMLYETPEVTNIAFVDDNVVTQSYPYTSFIGGRADQIFTHHIFELDGIKSVVFRHKEITQNDLLEVIISVDPSRIINNEIFQENLKLILLDTSNDDFLYGIENGHVTKNRDEVLFSEEQQKNAVEVETDMNTRKLAHMDDVVLKYIVWQPNFEAGDRLDEIIIMNFGIAISLLVPYLLFRSDRLHEKLKIKAIELQDANQKLNQNNDYMKKVQGLLIESEERYRNLYIYSPDPIRIVNLDGITVSCNENFKKTFDYTEKELKEMSFLNIIDERSLPLAQELFERVKKEDHIENKEIWYRKKDGTVFPCLVSISILKDKNNQAAGYISVIKDISEIYEARKKIKEHEKTLEEQLQEIKKIDNLKDEFSAMITHELRTPLVTINAYAQMLKEEGVLGTLNAEQMNSVNEIYESSRKLERLIDDMLDAQKMELKEMKFDMANFVVDEFMNEIIANHMPLMSDKKIDFLNTTKEKLGIKSDKDRLAQVFANLIRNSVDFVPENGRIEINAERKDDEVVFYVKDNGTGIPKEKQIYLFKKFYQIDTSLKRKHGGTGLGLVICKGIMDGLGGKIWVESDERKGTTVYFSLPV